MRSLFLLALGVACGVVGTVLFFTLDPSFDGEGNPNPGVGNARISLDEDALSKLVAEQLEDLSSFTDKASVKTDVREDGLITFDITIGTVGTLGVKSSITVDPEVDEGRLKINVVDASLGELALPDQVAEAIEAPLQARLDSLAGDMDYRLTSILTADHRLTLEIQV